MAVALRVLGRAGDDIEPLVPTWVAACDVDAMDGFGLAALTSVPSEALTFESFGEAMDFWRRQSNVRPLRDDGRPNRPLTAYTVTVEPL